MSDCYGRYFILNGKLMPSSAFSDSLIYEGSSFYEVLRLKRGIPYFYSDHISRLHASISISGKDAFPDLKSLRDDIRLLTEIEQYDEINLKIVFNMSDGISKCLVYYIKSAYPSLEQYTMGVKGIFIPAERSQPVSKKIHRELREEILIKLQEESAYEALLVNHSGHVTEGSRTNIFFISKDSLVTAPDDCVLRGITRKHILEICAQKNISVRYECPAADSIEDYSHVFMTGTSPIVLPFHTVDKCSFKVSHPLLSLLREEYMKLAEKSHHEF